MAALAAVFSGSGSAWAGEAFAHADRVLASARHCTTPSHIQPRGEGAEEKKILEARGWRSCNVAIVVGT